MDSDYYFDRLQYSYLDIHFNTEIVMRTEQIKINTCKVRVPVTLVYDDDRIFVKFGYNKALIAEVKNMEGAKWHGYEKVNPRKVWSIANSPRNQFQLAYLQGHNPYKHYDSDIIEHEYDRPLRKHQKVFADFMLAKRRVLLSGEMGCVCGETMVHINRGGDKYGHPQEISLKDLHFKFHGGVTKGPAWNENIPTYIRSLKGDTFGLHRIINTLWQGKKKVVLLTLKSGKSIKLTLDHEVCVGYNEFKAVESLLPGDTVLSNGRYIDDKGYVRLCDKKYAQHPRWSGAITREELHGYIYEHVIIIEEKLGRPLKSREEVHHTNEIRHDNRPENLEVFANKAEHLSKHAIKDKRIRNCHGIDGHVFIPHFDTVVSVEPAGECETYDIVCDDPYHNFVADDIIVKNCGKTLSAIEVMERSKSMNWFYCAPKSALRAVELEFKKWDMRWRPLMLTYEGMTKTVKEWPPGKKAPFGVVFDESARLKNPTSQRSQAAMHLANAIRQDHENGFVILMSGAPAPKAPTDWWHQCEVVCPGFLKEGNIAKFKKRLAIIVQKESVQGGMYPHIVSWLDDSKKCAECGEYLESVNHSIVALGEDDYHEFKHSKNEVAYLFERMKGLVHVKFKKDCLELPDKQYRTIELEPTQKIINLAQGIVSRARNTITAITQLRTLSDGFMYKKEDAGEEVCSVCSGKEELRPIINNQKYCDRCDNSGIITKTVRKTYQVESPKEQAVIDLLDEHIEVGRIVFYAGFTGSIERLVDICQKCDWQTIKADGHGWKTSFEGNALEEFQGKKIPRIAFIGQPGAAGTGLTLTASPTICYYSNDFNADNRIQSEDRCHRMGMDLNRGCTIIDLIHLPTDILVLENLQKKRALQSLTLGEISEVLK